MPKILFTLQLHNFEAHPFSLFAGCRQHHSWHDEFGQFSVIPRIGMDFAGRLSGFENQFVCGCHHSEVD